MERAMCKLRGFIAWNKVLTDLKVGKQKENENDPGEKLISFSNSEESHGAHFKEEVMNEGGFNLPKDASGMNASGINEDSNRSTDGLMKNLSLMDRNANLRKDSLEIYEPRKSSIEILTESEKKELLTLGKNMNMENGFYIVQSVAEFQYKSKFYSGSPREKSKPFCFEFKERKFTFPSLIKDKAIECSSLTICDKIYYTFEEDFKSKALYCLRVFLIFAIYLYILYEIATFLVGIYISYGNGFYLMTLLPAAIMFLITFFVVNFIMCFITTIIMHKFGDGVYKNKGFSVMKVMFWIFVPSQASNLHESIINYKELTTKYFRKEEKI